MRRLGLVLVAWLALVAPASAQSARTPVVGGGSYNDAPLLDPGSFSDTILPGERLFYGFKVQPGQSLHVTARLRGVSDDAFKDVADVWAVGIETPLREVEIQDLVARDVTGNGTLSGRGTARIEFVSKPALTLSAAREEEQTYRGPGTWFVNVYVATTKADPVRRELPIDLDVAVEGTPQQDPNPEPTPGKAQPPKASGSSDDGGPPGAAIAGLGVLGLAVGLVGGAALGRRR
jgi:Ca-activated chloride channel family protein